MEIANSANLDKAARHLQSHDPVLAVVISASGPCAITPHQDYYRSLTESIIGQQLSVKAAATIKNRFRDLFGGVFPEPNAILERSVEELRSCGLSGQKASYIRDLAQHIVDGRINFDNIHAQSNSDIITMVTDVKGVGEWTAHMFLMFCVGRLDVLPIGDLGIRNAIRKLYGLENAPTPQQITELAAQNCWHPYESIASWYLWRSLDNPPSN